MIFHVCGGWLGGHEHVHILTAIRPDTHRTSARVWQKHADHNKPHQVIPWCGYTLMDMFPNPETPFSVARVQHYLLSFYLMCEIKCVCWGQEVTTVFLFHDKESSTIQGDSLKRSTILKKGNILSVLQMNYTWFCHNTAGLNRLPWIQ